jgi:hypothetical protein
MSLLTFEDAHLAPTLLHRAAAGGAIGLPEGTGGAGSPRGRRCALRSRTLTNEDVVKVLDTLPGAVY